ncbi:MAG: di-trans,poly-cis-decaprenylcistransferase [Spirochaetales bacterium]|nr:di-trans,poly-cis-decaprenylcistransferase [Spirochaetales bacterium]
MDTPTTVEQSPILPAHIGIIMDGNGRWAQGRKEPRTNGHREGLNTAKRIVAAAADRGISFLTLYVFSTENWKRTEDEVSFLMHLIARHLTKEYDFYREKEIRVLHSGDLAGLPRFVQQEISRVKEDTKMFSGMTVNLAVNYGGRDEIIRGLKRWLEDPNKETLTEDSFSRYLDNPFIPDPDLIIRSAGEFRLSNFLLWQSAYSELYSSTKLWPDWTEEDLDEALEFYASRKRKFGGLA